MIGLIITACQLFTLTLDMPEAFLMSCTWWWDYTKQTLVANAPNKEITKRSTWS